MFFFLFLFFDQCPGGFANPFEHEKHIIFRFFLLEKLSHKLSVKCFIKICRDYCSERAVHVVQERTDLGLIQVFTKVLLSF